MLEKGKMIDHKKEKEKARKEALESIIKDKVKNINARINNADSDEHAESLIKTRDKYLDRLKNS